MKLDQAGHPESTRFAPPPTPYGGSVEDGPPIFDPYLDDPRAAGSVRTPPPRPAPPVGTWAATWAARLGWVSFLFGPVTALPALVLGIVGWRQASRLGDEASYERTVRRAHVGIVAGIAWVLLAIVVPGGLWAVDRWSRRAAIAEAAAPPRPPARALPPPVDDPPPYGTVPQKTQDELIGKVHVVTLGVQEASLEVALRREVVAAKATGTEVMLVTTRSGCEPCDGLQASFPNDLMQAALEKTRVVIVDVDVYGEDLDALGIDRSVLAGFFLLTPSLTPRDAIHGGEWGADIAANIAPVLGPFVRGAFDSRKFDYRVAHRFPARPERPGVRGLRPAPPAPPSPPPQQQPSSGVWL